MKRTFVVATLVAAAISTSATADESTWIFQPGRYTHSPVTGSRVAQYAPPPPVAALPDNSDNVSGYRRTLVRQRGADGSIDTYYRVESFGNGRGGLDAEWERSYDAARHGIYPGYGFGYAPAGYGYAPGNGYGPGYANPYGPGYGVAPGYSYGPGYGNPYGVAPGYAVPGYGGYQGGRGYHGNQGGHGGHGGHGGQNHGGHANPHAPGGGHP